MPSGGGGAGPVVGLIANPVSARDIRRVIGNAGTMQIADRVNVVLRVLTALRACGVGRVIVMPDRKGIRAGLERALAREHNLHHRLPAVEFVAMAVSGTVDDTHAAAAAMAAREVAAIVVLGGDGTHRAVVRACGPVPVAGLSTGTNNAYPDLREPTITGLATGLYATGTLPATEALATNKVLDVALNGRPDVALVDVVVSNERFIGARALWHPDALRELFVTFADPEAVGMSAVAGLLAPIGRDEPTGLRVALNGGGATRVTAPIGPGLVETVTVRDWTPLHPGEAVGVEHDGGVLALDGEREIELAAGDQLTVTLRCNAFRSVDVTRCMQFAAVRGLLRSTNGSTASQPTKGVLDGRHESAARS